MYFYLLKNLLPFLLCVCMRGFCSERQRQKQVLWSLCFRRVYLGACELLRRTGASGSRCEGIDRVNHVRSRRWNRKRSLAGVYGVLSCHGVAAAALLVQCNTRPADVEVFCGRSWLRSPACSMITDRNSDKIVSSIGLRRSELSSVQRELYSYLCDPMNS